MLIATAACISEKNRHSGSSGPHSHGDEGASNRLLKASRGDDLVITSDRSGFTLTIQPLISHALRPENKIRSTYQKCMSGAVPLENHYDLL